MRFRGRLDGKECAGGLPNRCTVISALHDLNLAAMYCDRLYVMKDGRIAASGAPQEILTAGFIREIYEVDAELCTDSAGRLHILYHPAAL